MTEFDGSSSKLQVLDLLIAKVVEKGAVISSVEFREDEKTGIGIFAKNVVETGSILISIPFKMCLSVNMIQQSSLNKILVDNPDLLSYPDEILAIALMSNLEHEWSEHANTLPTSLNSMLFWSENELVEIKDSNVYHLTKLMKRRIESDWQSIHGPISQQYPDLLPSATIEMYTWALGIIYSRAVGITRNGEYIRCIPPVLDMANHNPDLKLSAEDTLAYDSTNDRILFINTSPKDVGDECFAIYGNYPNSKLAYSYGFVILNCPYKAIDLWTRVVPSTSQAEQKQTILSSHDLTKNQTYDFSGTIREGWVSPALLATIRVIQCNEDEMDDVENAFLGKMVSVRNERASYVSLKNLLVARMKADIAEMDRKRLADMLMEGVDTRSRLFMALVIRVEERELLQSCVGLVNQWIDRLDTELDGFLPPDSVDMTVKSV